MAEKNHLITALIASSLVCGGSSDAFSSLLGFSTFQFGFFYVFILSFSFWVCYASGTQKKSPLK